MGCCNSATSVSTFVVGEQQQPARQRLQLPTHKDWTFLKQLGSGACANVFLARRHRNTTHDNKQDTNGECAVKVFGWQMSEAEQLPGLDMPLELDVMRRLTHPHLPFLREVVQVQNPRGLTCIGLAMEHGGDTLEAVLRRSDSFTYLQRRRVLFQLCDVVGFVHRHGVLHLDIKPSNVLLDPQHQHATLIDFGNSLPTRNAADEGAYSSEPRTTLTYRAPEHMLGGKVYRASSDVWSLGITMFRLFATLTSAGRLCGGLQEDILLARLQQQLDPKNIRRTLTDYIVENNIVPAAERSVLIELLEGMLDLNPTTRWSTARILTHPFFQSMTRSSTGAAYKTQTLRTVESCSSSFRRQFRSRMLWVLQYFVLSFSTARIETLCLSLDLLGRALLAAKTWPCRDSAIELACIWVATKTVAHDQSSCYETLLQVEVSTTSPEGKDSDKSAQLLTGTQLRKLENDLVFLQLEGLLYPTNVYHQCTSISHLKRAILHICDAEGFIGLLSVRDVPLGFIITEKENQDRLACVTSVADVFPDALDAIAICVPSPSLSSSSEDRRGRSSSNECINPPEVRVIK